MDKSGFKPAWMKINSTDKINDNEKILHDRSFNSIQSFVQGVRNSTRQRHHSSTQNASTFYSKSNERPTENSFQFRRSNHFIRKNTNDDSSSNSFHFHSKTSDQRRLHSSSSNDLPRQNILNNENSSTREQDFSSIHDELISINNNDESSSQHSSSSPDCFHSTLINRRKERLASAPTQIDDKRSTEKIKLFSESSHFSIGRSQNNVFDEKSAEKQFFKEMGWNEDEQQEFYQITEQDREIYEKRRQLVPKRHNRSAELMFALNRRSLPSINLQHLFQSNDSDLLSDDDDDDDNEK